MTIQELQSRLGYMGAKLSRKAGKLIVGAPPGAVTDEIKAALGNHKAVLMDELTEGAAPTSATSVALGPRPESAEVHLGPRDVRNGARWLPFHDTISEKRGLQ
jgi:hypothetical protein